MNVTVAAVRTVLLLLLVPVVLGAQVPAMHQYTVSDGLPGNELYNIFQDSKGFLWLASDAGVSRYDGYRFRNFTSRDGLADNTVFGFYEDRKGRIWFRTYSGLLSYFDGQHIISPPVNTALKKLLQGSLTLSLYVDAGDTLWIGRQSATPVLRVLPGFATVTAAPVFSKHGTTVCEKEPGIYFISSNNDSTRRALIFYYAYGSKTPLVLEALNDAAHISCNRTPSGATILCSKTEHYLLHEKQWRRFTDSLPLIRIVPDRSGRNWYCYASRKGVSLTVAGESGDRPLQRFLQGFTVTCSIQDREGGLWFSTLEKGLFYMPYPEVLEQTIEPPGTGEKLTVFGKGSGNTVLAGTSTGYLLNLSTGGKTNLGINKLDYISCLFSENNFSVVGATNGAYLFDEKLQLQHSIHDSSGIVPLYSIAAYDDNTLCGVSIRSAYRIDKKTGQAWRVAALPERMRCICRGRGDTLWMGGLNGLWMIAGGKAPVNLSATDSLLGQRIDFLYFDAAHDRLWISSKGDGLFIMEHGKVDPLPAIRPQMAATCRSITADDEGNIWIATNAGAYCIREKKGGGFSMSEFSMRNGLSTNDIIGVCRRGDSIWMASPDRVMRFSITSYPLNKAAPLLTLNSIKVNGKIIANENGAAENRFGYNNTIVFSYTGICYKSFGNLRYRFRLLGADSSWKETTSTEAVFYGLPPGEYTFSVYACNNDGLPSPQLAAYHFEILPPVWRRWWFLLSLLLLAGILLWLGIRYRLAQVRRKEHFNRRLMEMEMTALRAQMNPHFIFNAISSIQNFILHNENDAANHYLLLFSRLMRNVLDYSKEELITLQQENEMLQQYLEIESLRFKGRFQWQIELPANLPHGDILLPPLLLQPFVENALWHGLIPLEKQGVLHIRIRAEDEQLICVIEDNGIGREASGLHKRSTEKKRPHSTSINRERIEAVEQVSGKQARLDITDLYTPEGTPCGTRVTIILPLMKLS